MDWYLSVLKNYANFSGRARRTEYWMFFLFNFIVGIIAIVLDNFLGLTMGGLPYGVLYFIYALVTIIPGIAVTVRRLHDVGKSGWMLFISLIPLIGSIWLLVLLVTDGQLGDNQYGSDPKQLNP